MSSELTKLTPQPLWAIFADLCNIPRPSKSEAQVIDYVLSFAKKHNLEAIKDEVGNVILRKPASPGQESRKPIILQAHLDMVPQKNSATVHNFHTDPIQPFIDGEWVKAKGTTLGADNGIGVAAALAVMQSTSIKHGPVEVLLTIDEETGMTGAFNLKAGVLKGKTMINLDSEDEGELYIGCAGGINTSATFTYKTEKVAGDVKAYKLNLTGLKGGHSGVDIHLGRANANKLMNRFLWLASKELGLRISSIDGGSLRNAIPRESFVIITVPAAKAAAFEAEVKKFEETFKLEYASVEPDLSFRAEGIALPETWIDAETQKNLIHAVYAIPNGSIRMIAEMPEVVETSTNLAIVKSKENTVEVMCLLRSSVESAKQDLANMMSAAFELAGANVVHDGSYPGWKPDVHSPILHAMKEGYNKLYGKTPEIKVIHAGLECGIIGDKYPGMDMVSFGPTIRFPHSPDEKVNIATVEKFWNFLVATLETA